MSLLKTSPTVRLIASSARPRVQFPPTYRSFGVTSRILQEPKAKTSPDEAPATKTGESTLIRKESAVEGTPSHALDYDAVVDYRTSTFSPVPKRLMDGSEPGETVPAAILSGAPPDLQARTVRIFRPSKAATQSGDWNTRHWQMDWDPLPKGHRWENPLMGWQSTADFMQGERLSFKTKEDAIRFAHKQGYQYFVQEPNERKVVPKAYANNFVHSPKKLKKIMTK